MWGWRNEENGRKPCLWRWVRLVGIDYSGAQMPTASLKHYRGHLSGTISALRPLWRVSSFAPNRSVAARRGLSAI